MSPDIDPRPEEEPVQRHDPDPVGPHAAAQSHPPEAERASAQVGEGRNERPEGKSKEKKSSVTRTIIEIVVIVGAAFVIALLIQAFLVKPFTIHQVSMRPTLEEGDRILINRLAYRFRSETRGDIIVFHSPINADEDLVKRIVGLPGDRLSISGGKLYVNGVPQNEPYLFEQDINGEMPETTVPTGHVFVMGDNRNNSGDSRLFGPITTDAIIGKAFVVYWPISHWKTL